MIGPPKCPRQGIHDHQRIPADDGPEVVKPAVCKAPPRSAKRHVGVTGKVLLLQPAFESPWPVLQCQVQHLASRHPLISAMPPVPTALRSAAQPRFADFRPSGQHGQPHPDDARTAHGGSGKSVDSSSATVHEVLTVGRAGVVAVLGACISSARSSSGSTPAVRPRPPGPQSQPATPVRLVWRSAVLASSLFVGHPRLPSARETPG